MIIVVSNVCPDTARVERTLVDRLLSWPWRPWDKYTITNVMYVVDGVVFCSRATAAVISERPDITDRLDSLVCRVETRNYANN